MREGFQFEAAYLMLEPGKHLCLSVRDAAGIGPRFTDTVYHGTSLGALGRIMDSGFRPSLGAGSDEVGRQYNCSLPMLYTSELLNTAAGYVGNAQNGQRIGDGPMVNCVLWLKADTDMRLCRKKPTRNKSGQLRNEQQGYHPQDLRVTEIFLHCVALGTATLEQARFPDAQPIGKELRRNHPPLKRISMGWNLKKLFKNSFWAPPPPKIHKLICK